MTDREAMKMALAKLEHLWEIGIDAEYKVELLPEIRVLRQALAQPEQEPINKMPTKIFGPNLEEILNAAGFYRQPEQKPVAWLYNGHLHECDPSDWAESKVKPLYTAPPKREWVLLTDDDWEQLWQDIEDACDEGEVAYQEEAQKKHGEGHYYISSEDQWEYDKRTIRDLVEAKLKEKNGD